MARIKAKDTDAKQHLAVERPGKEPGEDGTGLPDTVQAQSDVDQESKPKKNGGWREVEALREKAALKASLADVWDEDFDLDEEILAELDHTAEFFTTQDDGEDETFDTDDELDEFFDEEEV